jgi:phosphatidyl-myo-inositol dimannoside synthase
MSLVFLAADFPPEVGGIQTYVAELCRALCARGEGLTVIATAQPEAEAFDAAVGFPVIRVTGAGMMPTALAMRDAATGVSPPPEAIIATKWSPEGVAAYLAARRLGVPYLVMGYGREFVQTGGNLTKWGVQQFVFRGAAGGMAISHYTRDLMQRRGLPPAKTHLIYAGVDPAPYALPDDAADLRASLGLTGKAVILTISRLVARKGQEQVLRAMQSLGPEVQAHYVIVGDGPRRAELEALAADLGLSKQVTFTGEIPTTEVVRYLHACDLFVMTSRDIAGEPIEGFGLVYLEANVCGKPVIAGATGGVADAVEEGVSGLLVDPEKPEEIAVALRQLLTDPQLARTLGEQGRQRALERFTWGHVAAHFQEGLIALGVRKASSC